MVVIKKLVNYFLSILIVLFSFRGFAQDSTKTKKLGLIVKADVPLPVADLVFSKVERDMSLTVEKIINRRNSVQVTGTYHFIKANANSPDSALANRRNIFQIIPEYKFFILKRKVCSGPYVGAYLKYIRDEEIWDEWTETINYNAYPNTKNTHFFADYYYFKYAIGAITGCQFYIRNRVTFDFLFGVGASKTFLVQKVSGENIGTILGSDLDGRLAFNVGYKF